LPYNVGLLLTSSVATDTSKTPSHYAESEIDISFHDLALEEKKNTRHSLK
jgi:hypothetical protein